MRPHRFNRSRPYTALRLLSQFIVNLHARRRPSYISIRDWPRVLMEDLYVYFRYDMDMNEITSRALLDRLGDAIFNRNSVDYEFVYALVESVWDIEGGQYDPMSDQKDL